MTRPKQQRLLRLADDCGLTRDLPCSVRVCIIGASTNRWHL